MVGRYGGLIFSISFSCHFWINTSTVLFLKDKLLDILPLKLTRLNPMTDIDLDQLLLILIGTNSWELLNKLHYFSKKLLCLLSRELLELIDFELIRWFRTRWFFCDWRVWLKNWMRQRFEEDGKFWESQRTWQFWDDLLTPKIHDLIVPFYRCPLWGPFWWSSRRQRASFHMRFDWFFHSRGT